MPGIFLPGVFFCPSFGLTRGRITVNYTVNSPPQDAAVRERMIVTWPRNRRLPSVSAPTANT